MQMNENRHLLMISLDAVSDEDVDFLLTQPNFAALRKRGTLARGVRSVFISNTYPVHTSVITGVAPAKHGLTENVRPGPWRKKPAWRCSRSEIAVPTLYDQAAAHGMTVCSVLCPVTAGARIDWNIPEIPGEADPFRLFCRMLAGGTPSFVLSEILRTLPRIRLPLPEQLDTFTACAAADALCRHRPNLTLLHLIDVDHQKHRFGPGSREAEAALRRQDGRLGLLTGALARAFPREDPAVLIFSDHGCLPVRAAADPNDILRQKGLIRRPGRKESDYDAFFHNAGGTAFLKILRKEKEEEVMSALEDVLCEPYAGRLLTREELLESGMGSDFCHGNFCRGNFCRGIEAADGFCFGEMHRGQHGYGLARAGYRVFYLAAGGGVPAGGELSGGSVLDICPLAADLLSIPLWEMDGCDRLGRG